MKRVSISIIVLLLVSLGMAARSVVDDCVHLNNVVVSRVHTTFNVSYDIAFGNDVRLCTIHLLISTDGGKTFNRLAENNITGDIGKIKTPGQKNILYDFSSDKEELANKQIVFKVEVASKDILKREMMIAAQAAFYPHLSYGLMFGMVKKCGWYVKVGSDFKFPVASYECTSADGTFWGTGENQITRLNITGGAMFRAAKWLYPYVGAGYGSYGLYWKDIDGNWAKVSDYSTAGVSLDAGVVFKFGKISITAGASNTMFKYTEAEVGFGIMF